LVLSTALVNGNKQTIDVPAKIVQDRTLAPLRFVGEAFGGQVNWDAADRTIRITTDTNETDPPSMSQVMVSEEVVNLRSGPSISYDKVASARKGEILHVLAHKDGWYQVSRGGITSWVADWVVDVAWEPDEPSIVEPEEPEIPAEEPTLPEPPLTEKPAVLAANEVWVSCEKDAQGLRVVVESGSRVDGSLTETENSIKYNFLWRKVLNQIELQEQVGSEKLSLNIANQSDCAIVEISLPKTMDDYQIINENNGLRQVIFFPNRITRISREVAGNDGDNIIIYTLTPGSYTSELKDNILEVKLESTAMGVERSEYEYKISPVLKKMTISESAGPVTTLEIMTQKLGDYNIFQTQEDNAINICLTAQKIKQPDRKNIVVIDPGHGGSETGAIRSGIQEKNINLAIALKVGQILKSQGMEVEYTRSGDSYMGRPERAEVANKLNAALFVSIHCNSHTTSQAHGTETYYYAPIDDAKLFMQKEQRSKLANYVQRELSRALGTADRGVKQAAYTVLVQTDMPSILTEVAFMSNPQELSLLTSKSFQDKAANAIASGILKYLGK
jgi:N-acetylmuramoyl-L-alanine amidase